ncbi:Hypothetical predicted protein, partial [Paramuricea clavata]
SSLHDVSIYSLLKAWNPGNFRKFIDHLLEIIVNRISDPLRKISSTGGNNYTSTLQFSFYIVNKASLRVASYIEFQSEFYLNEFRIRSRGGEHKATYTAEMFSASSKKHLRWERNGSKLSHMFFVAWQQACHFSRNAGRIPQNMLLSYSPNIRFLS